MRRARLLAVAVGCWLALCIQTTTRAEEGAAEGSQPANGNGAEATRAFLAGKKYFDAGEYALAREQLEKAFALTGDPDLLYNLGQAYRLTGECERALEAYERFLQSAPNSPWAERARSRVTALRASCPPPTAEPRTTVAEQPRVLTPPTPRPRRRTRLETRLPSTTQSEPADRGSRWGWTWATLTTGLAATGVALGLEIWNQQRYAVWRERDLSLREGAGPGETDSSWLTKQEHNDQLAKSIESVDRAALVTGIGGAALVVASGVLFRIAASSPSEPLGTFAPSSRKLRAAQTQSKHPLGMHLRTATSDLRSAIVVLSMSY